MKYIRKFDNYIKESKEFDRIRELINEIEDSSFLEIDKKDYDFFDIEKIQENWEKMDMKYLERTIAKLQINCKIQKPIKRQKEYIYSPKPKEEYVPIDEYRNITIEFNPVGLNLVDYIIIKKYENGWFLLEYYTDDNKFYYLVNEIEGISHFIMEKLFMYSNNILFLSKIIQDRFYLIEDYLDRENDYNNYYPNRFSFYKSDILSKLILKEFEESLFKNGNLLEFLKKHNLHSISNLYYLLENKMISKETMQNFYPESLVIKENQLYLYFDASIPSLDFMFNREYQNLVENCESDDSDYHLGYNYSFRDLSLNYLTKDAISVILKKIEEIKNGMDEDELSEFDEYPTWEEQVDNIDLLCDIKTDITDCYEFAQQSADMAEMYKAITYPICSFFEMNELLRYKDGLLIKINKDWLIRFDTFSDSISYYNGKYKKTDLTEDILKNLFEEVEYNEETIEGKDRLKVDEPAYGWDGYIDEKYLEEEIKERLS